MEKKKHVWALVLAILMFISAWVSLISKFVSMGHDDEDYYLVATRVNVYQTNCDVCKANYVNGFCNCEGDAEFQQPVVVTAGNREALALGDEYLGYCAISNAGELFWFLNNAYDNTVIWYEEYGYGDKDHLPPENKAVLLNDIYVNGSKDSTEVSMCNGVKNPAWRDLADACGIQNAGTDYESEFSSIVTKLVFDGRNHVISGIYQSKNYGIFANVVPGSYDGYKQNEVKDFGIVNSYFCGGGSLAGHMYQTKVSNIYNEGTVDGPNCVMGTGGLIGYGGDLEIVNCYNEGYVNATTGSVGGFVGALEGDSNIVNCYNAGNVVSSSSASGFIGSVYQWKDIEIHNCYNYGSVSSSNPTSDVSGLFGSIRDVGSGKYSFYAKNCYYNSNAFSGSAVGDTQYASNLYIYNCDSRTYDEFASGKVAYELNNNNSSAKDYKQSIGKDVYPNFTGSTVFKTKEYECDGETFVKEYYSNLNENVVQDHKFEYVETVDPDWDNKTDGYELYVCENDSSHQRKVVIPWKGLGSNIMFEENGGSEVNDLFLQTGSVVSDLDEPTRKGFVFVGWYRESYLSTEIDDSFVLEMDTVLYAKWVKCDHSLNENERDCEHNTICSVCSEEIPAHPHSGEWVTTKEPTATEDGERRRICSECGKEEIEIIAKEYSKPEPEVKEENNGTSVANIITIISTAIGTLGAGGAGIASIGRFIRKRKFGI